MKIIDWAKKNKLLVIILLVAAYFLFNFAGVFFGAGRSGLNYSNGPTTNSLVSEELGSAPGASFGVAYETSDSSYIPRDKSYAPQADVDNRLVIQESNMSLLVKDVSETRNSIVKHAETSGGYMVSSNISNPQDTPTSTVVVRVPSDKLEESLNYFRSLSVKVVSENLLGRDVTDQYIDIDTRITQLIRTKSRLEAILDQAKEISDITNITQQILNYQNQIDSLKGQQDALEKNAQLAKLTIYLSTDEIALPYAPSETFRPKVIFKLAVRSLVGTLRGLATKAIWIGVYSVIWIPALAIYIIVKKWLKRRKPQTPDTRN